jgi:DNA-binding CsgD family transcriptional regulator
MMPPSGVPRVCDAPSSDPTVLTGPSSSHERSTAAKHLKIRLFRPALRTDVSSTALVLAIALFGAIAAMIGVDLAADARAGTAPTHLLTEGVVMAGALVGAATLWRLMSDAGRRMAQLSVDLEAARREADRFRGEARDALRGLSEAIDRQFTRWSLTPAEREIGLLLLKGLTHKEIAEARSTSETTIRQQALAVYRKSGLRGRTELSAFFLEDLLLPVAERGEED